MRLRDSLMTVLTFFSVSILIFASDVIEAGSIEDIRVTPAFSSLLLLIPLFIWYIRYQGREGLSPEQDKEGGSPWLEVLLLFLLAMIVRIPMVQLLGMSFEKTAVIYLVVLTIVLVKKSSVNVFGLMTTRFSHSLLVGLAYYLVFAVPLFTVFFTLTFIATGTFALAGYNPLPAILVFPFMTFCVGISEEVLFRGFIQTQLTNVCTQNQALLVQAVLFGLWHFVWHISPFNPVSMIVHVSTTFLVGLVFGFFFKVSGNLIPLILAHGLVDTIGYGAIYRSELESLTLLLQGFEAISFIIGIVALTLATRYLASKTSMQVKT